MDPLALLRGLPPGPLLDHVGHAECARPAWRFYRALGAPLGPGNPAFEQWLRWALEGVVVSAN